MLLLAINNLARYQHIICYPLDSMCSADPSAQFSTWPFSDQLVNSFRVSTTTTAARYLLCIDHGSESALTMIHPHHALAANHPCQILPVAYHSCILVLQPHTDSMRATTYSGCYTLLHPINNLKSPPLLQITLLPLMPRYNHRSLRRGPLRCPR